MSDGASLVSLEAQAEPAEELLRAPASGQPCVHWRLRVVEHLTARTELVHDLASPESFELAWELAHVSAMRTVSRPTR